MPSGMIVPRRNCQSPRTSFTPQVERAGIARRHPLEQPREEEPRRDEQRDAHPDLDRAARHAGDDTGAEPRPDHGGGDHQGQRYRVDLDDGDADESLRDRGQRVADVEGAWNQLVPDQLPQAEVRRRGGETPDAQGVEEVGDEADDDSLGIGAARVRRVGVLARLGGPIGHEDEGQDPECDEQSGDDHSRPLPSRGLLGLRAFAPTHAG
jgi:hypothetical protein